jgi:hypothetical protein
MTLRDQFDTLGFVRIDDAFPRSTADAALDVLWRDTGLDRNAPATWTRPVIRLGMYTQAPFIDAANTPTLHAAYDALVGAGAWKRPGALGTFVARFPSAEAPSDDGWHVDASFPGAAPHDYFQWRINAASRGRLLLMLFLFTDTGADDAPTRLREGSHRTVATLLQPHGDDGLSFMELAQRLDATRDAPERLATGRAGTVYLCHPFLVHAAQSHRGAVPRFLAQPPLLPR